LAIAIILLVSLAAGSAYAQTGKCQGAKMKAAGKKAGCLLKVHSKAAAKALPVDTTKITGCETKFSSAFTKAESKPPCATTGDAGAIESKVDRFADEVAAELALSPPSKCQGGKLKSAGKLGSCLLGVEAKGIAKSLPPDTTKLAACKTKFSAGFTKAESAADCGPATGDTAVIQAKLEALEDDVACELDAGPACACGTPDPAFLSFTTALGSGNCGSTVNDLGSPITSLACNNLYTGGGAAAVPPSTVPDYGNTITKTSCCRSKFLTLSVATSTDTGSNRNCSNTGCLYGPPLPIISATSVCVINTVAQPAAGYSYCDAGSVNLDLPLSSAVYLAFDLLPNRTGTQPCPVCLANACVGDATHDGIDCTMNSDCGTGTCATGNTCHGGPNDGIGCTPGELLVTGEQWPTSHDCPAGGFLVGSLPIPYLLTTGTATKTSVNQPSQPHVFCGFCSDPSGATFKNPVVACASDAECAAFTTGCAGPCTACKQRTGGAFGSSPVRTITENGAPAGPIATGGAPASQTLVSVFCIPPTFNGSIDSSGDLPGPGAAALQGSIQLLP